MKMTLLDFPGKVACTVFLGGCDFRCPFCHNFELIDGSAPPLMDEEELFAFLKKRKGLLDGVAVTGGEPCLHPGLADLLRNIRALGFATKLDTNGYHPAALRDILDAGLADYVAMDVKNSPEKYALTCGVETLDMSKIRESIDILKTGSVPYEFRTTVVDELHEAQDIEKIGEMIRGAGRYFLQCFTDRDSVPVRDFHAPNADKIRDFLMIARRFVPDAEWRGVEVS